MKAKPKAKARLTDLQVGEISFVDEPAVPKAKFLVAKRHDGGGAMDELEKRIAMQGYTGSAPGATTPAHIHEYWCYLDRDTGQMSGNAYAIADHSHRITPESYARGETEQSDGHMHALMTIKEARALLSAGQTQQEPLKAVEKLLAEMSASLATAIEKIVKAIPVTPAALLPAHDEPVKLTPEEMATLEKIIAAHGTPAR